MLGEDILRLAVAALAGAIVGVERELHDKPAGFRTNMLICVGAAMFTILSRRLAEGTAADPTRIAAQIVSGVGFLGAGAIIQSRGNVYGLTTAATIWVVAAIGVALGGGHYLYGLIASAAVAAILYSDRFVFERLQARHLSAHFKIDLAAAEHVTDVRALVNEAKLKPIEWLVSRKNGEIEIHTTVTGEMHAIDALQTRLLNDERVVAFTRH